MSLKSLLTDKLPERCVSSRKMAVNPYKVAEEIGCTHQAIYVWLKNDDLPLAMAQRLVEIEGSILTLRDLRPYCSDLDSVLSRLEKEESVIEQGAENQ